MRNWFLSARSWLVGKKMYIAGSVLMLVAIIGPALGRMDVITAIAIGGYGMSLCGISARSSRQHREMVVAIQMAAAVGIATRTGGIAAAVAEGEKCLSQVVVETTEAGQA